MLTRVAPFSDETIAEATQLILSGHPVAVPTETVYGLAANAMSADAVSAIYAAKGRPAFNPLIVHVADLNQAMTLGKFNQTAIALGQSYWPGPLTLVLPLRTGAGVPAITTAGLATIALRVPDHRAMRALLASTGVPLAAPSANASGTLSPTCADHVLRTLDSKIPMVIDDGPTTGGIESTIIKVDGDAMYRLRPGPVMIENAIIAGEASAVEAPGQMTAHYAPSKPLRLNAMTADDDEWHLGFGSITGDISLSANGDVQEAAAALFDLLHAADRNGAKRIAVAPIPNIDLGQAINDRLHRAAEGTR